MTIYKRTINGKKSREWYYAYKSPETGKRVIKRGFSDKEATREKARAEIRAAERRAAGLEAPNEAARRMPIADAHEAYLNDLKRLGASTIYVRDCRNLIRRLIDACKWKTLGDVRREPLQKYLSELRESGRSARTHNAYLSAAKTFLKWCVEQSYLTESPIHKVKKVKESKATKTNLRRSFTPEEIKRLLAVVPDRRKRIYQLAATTGFRRRTLRGLKYEHLDYSNPDRPTWRIPATLQKNKRDYTAPASPDAIAAVLPIRKLSEKILQALPLMRTFNHDLETAEIPKVDDRGRSLVFHSFRYFFAVEMAKRLPIQKVKLLLGHETLAMTADLYSQLGLEDIGEEVWSLPTLFS